MGSGGGESKGEEQHQTPRENPQTGEMNGIEEIGGFVKTKDQGSEGEEEAEKEGKLDDSFPCAQSTKKRAAQSPLMKEIEKKDRMGQMSESSSSGDLNRLFPLNTANEISFLSIELKTSTPRAVSGSSGERQAQTPDSYLIGIKEGPDLQEMDPLE